ncbi:hypothetical protein [Microcystis aeruginosa]|jgi:hypothetical protein|uniref:hypothetical protein n=1 Tax=Microcystis aeruginosa TaxID=1126 RepID=UPI00292FC63A|nr:hypothetical protein [Microcystis aeruginosa]WOB67916.1 hypothetical protein PJW00_20625 [Microcystis aeruginosa LE3]
MAVLKFNQEDNGDHTTFFGIPLTAAINVHGAFPKSERFVAGLALGNAPYSTNFIFGVAELSYESVRNRHFLKLQIMN